MNPPSSRQADIELLQRVGERLIRETKSDLSISTVKALESDVRGALAVLHRRINPYESPIYRLHPEILPLIASQLETNDLVKMSHVSHHWRTVLLSHPSVWSNLDFTHVERASLFLARSKSAPIRVFLQSPATNIPLPLELLNQSAERIAVLSLGNYSSQGELLLRTMPSLRTLRFYPDRGEAPPDGMTPLFFPALETLCVGSVDPLPFSAPRLTRFVFSGFGGWTKGGQMADALLDFLSSCPSLEELEIDRDFQFYTRHDHRDVVHLPHLRTYTHSSIMGFYLGLYKLLSFPPSCSVTFCCGCAYPSVGPLPPFQKSTFFADVRRVKLKTEHRPRLTGGVARRGYVEGVVEIIDAAHRRVRSKRQASLGKSRMEEIIIDFINPLYSGFLKGLDPRSVEILCVEGPTPRFRGEIGHVEEVLDHLEHIRTLILSDAAVTRYLSALSPDACVGGWRCLKLETLVIYTSNLSEYEHSGLGMLADLSYFLRKRKAAGLPLKTVSLFYDWEWRLGGMELEELRGCVGVVELLTGDDALDWDVDDYFLSGLANFRRV